MTEQKICEMSIIHIGDAETEIEEWNPLDPQPCCANCPFKYSCTVRAMLNDMFPNKASADTFFCSEWEAK